MHQFLLIDIVSRPLKLERMINVYTSNFARYHFFHGILKLKNLRLFIFLTHQITVSHTISYKSTIMTVC